jgi:hypothetical protein
MQYVFLRDERRICLVELIDATVTERTAHWPFTLAGRSYRMSGSSAINRLSEGAVAGKLQASRKRGRSRTESLGQSGLECET